jgi:hypothetical protein
VKYSLALIIGCLLLTALAVAWAQAPDAAKAVAEKVEPEVKKAMVTVVFGTEPRKVKATVYHGRKKLGKTPFTHEFERDSGPVDLVFKAYGHVTVNTRAHTFQDAKLIVKMTKNEDRSTIYGYKEEIPPDAGVPPANTSQPSLIPWPISPPPATPQPKTP